MKEYTVLLANKKDLKKYLGGGNVSVRTLKVEVEANSPKEASEKAEGFKKMTVWKVDNEVAWLL